MTEIKQEVDYTYIDAEKGLCTINDLDFKNRSIFLNRLNKEHRKLSAAEFPDRISLINIALMNTAYQYMLETNESSKECLIYAATVHQKDIEGVLAEKTKPSKRMNQLVVRNNDDHPVQKDMKKTGILPKRPLYNASNVWQLLNTLSNFRDIYERLVTLEREVKGLTDKMDNIEVDLTVAKADIKRLETLNGIEQMSDKDKAAFLKSEGYNQKVIANNLNKSLRTIKRWWDDL